MQRSSEVSQSQQSLRTVWSHSSSSHTSISVAMETSNGTETWYKSLHAVLKALNTTLHSHLLCRPGPGPGPGSGTGPDNQTEDHRASLPGRDDNSYMYILFVMFLFAVTVGSLILGYTRSRKVDKRSDPYHVYIKNRVSMIWGAWGQWKITMSEDRLLGSRPYQATVPLSIQEQRELGKRVRSSLGPEKRGW